MSPQPQTQASFVLLVVINPRNQATEALGCFLSIEDGGTPPRPIDYGLGLGLADKYFAGLSWPDLILKTVVHKQSKSITASESTACLLRFAKADWLPRHWKETHALRTAHQRATPPTKWRSVLVSMHWEDSQTLQVHGQAVNHAARFWRMKYNEACTELFGFIEQVGVRGTQLRTLTAMENCTIYVYWPILTTICIAALQKRLGWTRN